MWSTCCHSLLPELSDFRDVNRAYAQTQAAQTLWEFVGTLNI